MARSLIAHLLIWAILTVVAYVTAGPYSLATCWPLIMLFPPGAVLLVAIPGYSLLVMLASLFRPKMRLGASFQVACHGMIATLGLIVCRLAAFEAVGQVNCL